MSPVLYSVNHVIARRCSSARMNFLDFVSISLRNSHYFACILGDMQPTFVIAGKLNREYILPASGQPLLDSPGGSLLYAAGGLAVWGDANAGLLGRVGEDYPRQWVRDLEERGFDTRGIRTLRELQNVDLRTFVAFTDSNERSYSNAVSHFARRQLAFPKSLLGYQAPDEFAQRPA